MDSDSEEELLIPDNLRKLKSQAFTSSQSLFSQSQSQRAKPAQSAQRVTWRGDNSVGRLVGKRSSHDQGVHPGSSVPPHSGSKKSRIRSRLGPASQSQQTRGHREGTSPSGSSEWFTTSDSVSSPDKPVMLSLASNRARRGRGRGRGRTAPPGVGREVSSEVIVIPETSGVETISETDSDSSREAGSKAKAVVTNSTVAKAKLSSSMTGSSVPAPKHKPARETESSLIRKPPSKPYHVETRWLRETLTSDEEDEEDEITQDEESVTPTCSKPVEVRHSGAVISSQPCPPSVSTDKTDSENELELPVVTFSSKRRQQKVTHPSGLVVGTTRLGEGAPQSGSQTPGKRLFRRQGGNVQLLKNSHAHEVSSSDADTIDSIDSGSNQEDNPQSRLQTLPCSNKLSIQTCLPKTPERDQSVAGENSTVTFEDSATENLQYSPSILQQETECLRGDEDRHNENDGLHFVQIDEVRSLNPDKLWKQAESSDQDDAKSDQVLALNVHRTTSQESDRTSRTVGCGSRRSSHLTSTNSDMTQPYKPADNESSQVPPSLSCVPSVPSMLGRQVSGESISPPLLTKVSSDVVPDSSSSTFDGNRWPTLLKSAWPALSLSSLGQVKKENKDLGADVLMSVSVPGSSEAEQSPVYRVKREREFAGPALSVTVSLPRSDGNSSQLQTLNQAEPAAQAENLTISVSMSGSDKAQALALQGLKRDIEESAGGTSSHVAPPVKEERDPPASGLRTLAESPGVFMSGNDERQPVTSQGLKRDAEEPAEGTSMHVQLPVKEETDPSASGSRMLIENPSEPVGDAESDSSQCLFDTLPMHTAGGKGKICTGAQAVQEAQTQELEVYMSDAEEEFGNGPLSRIKMESRATPSAQAPGKSDAGAEPMGYTLEDDLVVVFDSDEEEMFRSFTQVEVKAEGTDDEEDLWCDDISDKQLLEAADGHGSDKDEAPDISLGDGDDGCHGKVPDGGDDFVSAMDSDDEALLVAASHDIDLAPDEKPHAQPEKLPSVFSQPTLIDEDADGLNGNEDDIYSKDTLVDDEGSNDGKSAMRDNSNAAKSGRSETEDEKGQAADDFDDDMDDELYSAATQIDMEAAVPESSSPKTGNLLGTSEETSSYNDFMPTPSQVRAKQTARKSMQSRPVRHTVKRTARKSMQSQSGSTAVPRSCQRKVAGIMQQKEQTKETCGLIHSKPELWSGSGSQASRACLTSHVVDLTVESSEEDEIMPVLINKELSVRVKQEAIVPEQSEVQDSEGLTVVGEASRSRVSDGAMLVDGEHLDGPDSSADTDASKGQKQHRFSSETVALYNAQTLADAAAASDGEEEEFDLYAMATQRDDDPYLAQTQVDLKLFFSSDSEPALGEKDDVSSERGEKRKHPDAESGSESDNEKSTFKSASTGEMKGRESSSESESDPCMKNESEDRIRRKHFALQLNTDTEQARDLKSASASKGKSLVQASRSFDSARETMININKKNLVAGVIEIEPQAERPRRGKNVGLKQKLCHPGPLPIPKKDSKLQRFLSSSSSDCSMDKSSSEHKTPVRSMSTEQMFPGPSALSDMGWLGKKPDPIEPKAKPIPALYKPPQSRKRLRLPPAPELSEFAKKARLEMEARRMKAIMNPAFTSVGRHKEKPPQACPDMDTDVELPNTQEVFDLRLPLMTATLPVSKERLARTEETARLSSSSSVSESRHLSVSAVMESPHEEHEGKAEKSERRKGREARASKEQKTGSASHRREEKSSQSRAGRASNRPEEKSSRDQKSLSKSRKEQVEAKSGLLQKSSKLGGEPYNADRQVQSRVTEGKAGEGSRISEAGLKRRLKHGDDKSSKKGDHYSNRNSTQEVDHHLKPDLLQKEDHHTKKDHPSRRDHSSSRESTSSFTAGDVSTAWMSKLIHQLIPSEQSSKKRKNIFDQFMTGPASSGGDLSDGVQSGLTSKRSHNDQKQRSRSVDERERGGTNSGSSVKKHTDRARSLSGDTKRTDGAQRRSSDKKHSDSSRVGSSETKHSGCAKSGLAEKKPSDRQQNRSSDMKNRNSEKVEFSQVKVSEGAQPGDKEKGSSAKLGLKVGKHTDVEKSRSSTGKHNENVRSRSEDRKLVDSGFKGSDKRSEESRRGHKGGTSPADVPKENSHHRYRHSSGIPAASSSFTKDRSEDRKLADSRRKESQHQMEESKSANKSGTSPSAVDFREKSHQKCRHSSGSTVDSSSFSKEKDIRSQLTSAKPSFSPEKMRNTHSNKLEGKLDKSALGSPPNASTSPQDKRKPRKESAKMQSRSQAESQESRKALEKPVRPPQSGSSQSRGMSNFTTAGVSGSAPMRMRPPTPPRKSDKQAFEAQQNMPLTTRSSPQDSCPSRPTDPRDAHSRPKTVRFNPHVQYESKRAVNIPARPSLLPSTLPTFEELLARKMPPQQKPPLILGNPLQKKALPLQEQQLQQFVFKPLVVESQGCGQPSSSGGGQRLLEVDDFMTHILRWSPQWLLEHEKNLQKSADSNKMDCLKLPPVVDQNQLYPLLTAYGDKIVEYQQICFKLLLLETWEDIFRSWKESRHRRLLHVVLADTSKPQLIITLGWIGLITGQELRSRLYPVDGDIVEVRMVGRHLSSNVAFQASTGDTDKSFQLAYVDKVNISKCQDVRQLITRHPPLKNHPAVRKHETDLFVFKITLKTRYRKFAPNNKSLITIAPVGSLAPAKRRFAALQMLPRCSLMRDVLNPSRTTFGVNVPANLLSRTQFNTEQSLAIRTMYAAVTQPVSLPRICLLQGPPGTGKSYVIIGLILMILHKGKKDTKICLAAPSNAAVDELLRRLVRRQQSMEMNFSVVRIGKLESTHSDVKECSLEHRVIKAQEQALLKKKLLHVPESVKTENERLQQKISKLTEKMQILKEKNQTSEADALMSEIKKTQKKKDVLTTQIDQGQQHVKLTPAENAAIYARELKGPQVVCGTLSSFGQQRIINTLCRNTADNRRNNHHFTCAIIDEATQATELDSLIPLQFGMTKLFLIGDPNQLPPTVLSTKAQSLNYGLSLFERMYNFYQDESSENLVMMLRTQYRMDPAICRFPNQHIYRNLLRTDEKVQENCQKFPLVPYLIFDVEESQELLSQSGTLSNEMEAECTAVLCEQLINCGLRITPGSIGIICPYTGQKRLVSRKLQERGISGIEVNTVDGFQGREKQIIILSCVRARSCSGGIGFMADKRRMNVALTRAKYSLYIIGHLESLRSDSDWNSLINDAKEEGRQVAWKVGSVEAFPAIIQRCVFKPKFQPRVRQVLASTRGGSYPGVQDHTPAAR